MSTRGYATAYALPSMATRASAIGDVAGGLWGKKSHLLARSMSDAAVPEPPTSNHPHTPVPGSKGQLIYTET